MWRIYLSVFVLLYLSDGIFGFLTIGWSDQAKVERGQCGPDSNLTVSTPVDYLVLFSAAEAEPITEPCFCELHAPDDANATLWEATVSVSTFIADNFTTLLTLQGEEATQLGSSDGSSASLFIEVSPGDGDPQLSFPVLEEDLSLNSSIYIVISDAKVLLRCSTDPIFIFIAPPTPTLADATNNDVVQSGATWLYDTHVLIVIAVAVLIAVSLLLCLAICCVRKRRRRIKEEEKGIALVVVDDKDWRHSSIAAQPINRDTAGNDTTRATSFEEIDTFIDEEGDDKETAVVASDSFERPAKARNSVTHADYVGEQSMDAGDDIYKPESITGNTLPFPIKPNTPDLVKRRGIYDNIDKAKGKQVCESGSYVKAGGDTVSKGDCDKSDKTDCDSLKEISEVPEYAEIEEMQMLLRNKKKTERNASIITNNSESSNSKAKTAPRKKSRWKFWNSNDKKKGGISNRSLPKTPRSKSGDMTLTRLDFSQLKDAIDKMEPEQVKEKMKQVADTTQNENLGSEPIYCNDPVSKPGTERNKNNSNNPYDCGTIPKYDSPKSNIVKPGNNQSPGTALASNKSDLVPNAEKSDSKVNEIPGSAKSKWNFVDPPKKSYFSTLNRVNDSPFKKHDALMNETKANKPNSALQPAEHIVPHKKEETKVETNKTQVPLGDRANSRNESQWKSPLKVIETPVNGSLTSTGWPQKNTASTRDTKAVIPSTAAVASPRSKWDRPVSPLTFKTVNESPRLNERPESPRGKWGAPVDVSLLYAQPEKPSRLPRPTSPVPTTSASPLATPLQTHNNNPMQSSYHVPKSPPAHAFKPPPSTQRTAFSIYQSPTSNQGVSRPSVISSRSMNSQFPSTKPVTPCQRNAPAVSSPPAKPARASAFPVLGSSMNPPMSVSNAKQSPFVISSRKY